MATAPKCKICGDRHWGVCYTQEKRSFKATQVLEKKQFDREAYQRDYMRNFRNSVAFVYGIRGDLGPIKIGMTNNIVRRLTDMQSYSPIELRLVTLWEAPSFSMARKIEEAVHFRLSEMHSHREWFNCSVEEAEQAIKAVGGTKRVDHASIKPTPCVRKPWERSRQHIA